jgi:Uma2 family endonuclease
MATRRPEPYLTYEDYVHFPEGQRWELLDGEAFVIASPTARHQDIALRLARVVADHLDVHGGGRVFIAPFDVVLSPGDVVQPDVVFISDARMDVLTEANVWGTPDWAVEVLSDPHRDRELKRQRYANARIPEYWIIDPDTDRVEIYRLSGGSYPDPEVAGPPATVSPGVLPGLRIELAALLRR